jgi:hypothetical protein
MRVINVIVVKGGAVYEIESFGVFEEQLANDVVEPAEKLFETKVLELVDTTLDDFEDNYGSMESFIEDGIFMNGHDNSVCLTWSEIE